MWPLLPLISWLECYWSIHCARYSHTYSSFRITPVKRTFNVKRTHKSCSPPSPSSLKREVFSFHPHRNLHWIPVCEDTSSGAWKIVKKSFLFTKKIHIEHTVAFRSPSPVASNSGCWWQCRLLQSWACSPLLSHGPPSMHIPSSPPCKPPQAPLIATRISIFLYHQELIYCSP